MEGKDKNIVWEPDGTKKQYSSSVIFDGRPFREIHPSTKDFERAHEVKVEIEDYAKQGKEISLWLSKNNPLLNSSMEYAAFSEMNDLPRESKSYNLSVAERAALLAVLGVYPKSDIRKQDRVTYVYDNESGRIREGEVEVAIHNVFRIEEMKNVYCHELAAGLCMTTNVSGVVITVGKDYSSLENRLPTTIERAKRKISEGISKAIFGEDPN